MRWSQLDISGKRPPALYFHSTMLTYDRLLIFGGYDGQRYHNTLHIFDMHKNHFDVVGSRNPSARAGQKTAQSDNSHIYFYGGYGNDYLNDFYLMKITEQ